MPNKTSKKLSSLCFIDTETTGLSASYNRVMEIGILKVEDDKVVKEFKTLINPETSIDPFVSQMTGISQKDLENAPLFYDIKDELLEILRGSIFVAHNARFDYGFIKNEFKRLGITFKSKHLCTVKLARALYPKEEHYNLDSIIERFNIKCKNRHRAYDDAKVLWQFYQKSKKNIKPKLFEEAISKILKKPTLPINIKSELLDNLPEKPGVYVFYGKDGEILYIGKSIDIKERVLSHFSNDQLSIKDMKISQQIFSIETIETAGELSALLLESTMVKKYKPIFNRMLRESRKMPILLKTVNSKGYNSVLIKELDEVDPQEIGNILGVFKNLKQIKEFLYELSKENNLCPKILGLEKGKGCCFNYHLGTCSGACKGEEKPLKYNLRFDNAFFKKKVKRWNFGKPILIKEKNGINETKEIHVIDQWCYLGSIKSEDEINDLKREYRFDYDTYKILLRYIMNPQNSKNISLLG